MNSPARTHLDQAEFMLAATDLAGVWPRCVCWLLRASLEQSLRRFWLSRRPEVAECSWRAQLLALTKFVDADTRHRVNDLWATLSQAGHHRQYELAPTEMELRRWSAETRRLTGRLERQP